MWLLEGWEHTAVTNERKYLLMFSDISFHHAINKKPSLQVAKKFSAVANIFIWNLIQKYLGRKF
jgi:hypothetical protein